MRTIAHISDLHFGKDDPRIAAGLLEALSKATPDIIVVSGDLTQRAKKRQFRAAREFLSALPPVPQIVVPGNHDASTTNLFERVIHPLGRYRRFIASDLSPFYNDDEIAIAGLNTVRLMSAKDGRINRAQVDQACTRFNQSPAQALRIVVTHHPLDLPADDLLHPTVSRAKMAMTVFARCGVDLFLSGHLHGGLTLTSSERYPMPGHSAVIAHAGTAISTRTRNEPNAWNLIRLATGLIEVQQMTWNTRKFTAGKTDRYRKQANGWMPAEASASTP